MATTVQPSIYVDRTTTWHAIGKSVEECKSMEQVLQKSGLDYTVVKRQLMTYSDGFAGSDLIEVPGRFITARDNDGHLYDVVSDKFEIVQNRDAFDFVNFMGGDLSFEKAGETASGMIYIIGKLPEVDILGDSFIPHVIFRNGFNGKVKITAAVCPLRIVCQNQFNFAFKNTQNTVVIRHVQNAQAKLADARETLKMSADYMAELTKMAEGYAATKLDEVQLDRLLHTMFPLKGAEDMNAFKRHNLEEELARFRRAYLADDNTNFKGTAWGVINAYTDFITHKIPQGKTATKEEGKFVMVTFHPGLMNSIFRHMAAAGIAV